MIAVPVLVWHLYLAATGRTAVALPALAWIGLATALLWMRPVSSVPPRSVGGVV